MGKRRHSGRTKAKRRADEPPPGEWQGPIERWIAFCEGDEPFPPAYDGPYLEPAVAAADVEKVVQTSSPGSDGVELAVWIDPRDGRRELTVRLYEAGTNRHLGDFRAVADEPAPAEGKPPKPPRGITLYARRNDECPF